MTCTIEQSILDYIDSVSLARSENTAKTYGNALKLFSKTLDANDMALDKLMVESLSENAILWFATDLKGYSPATERLYLTAVKGYYEYVAAEQLADINLPRLRLLIRQRARRPGQRLPQFQGNFIEAVLNYVDDLISIPVEDEMQRLRNMRD